MINYKKNKIRYKVNELGSLYIDKSKLKDNKQPIIYIGGQMEHRGHILEQSGYTFDQNHNMYTGSWMYDYPIFSKYKKEIDAKNFSKSLLETLKLAKLKNVILVSNSHGGLIASYASKSKIIDKVICIHSPLLGTPLANPKTLKNSNLQLTKKEKILICLLNIFVNSKFGFEQDNYKGIDLSLIDLNKLIIIGNSIDENSDNNKLLLSTSKIIKKITGYNNDGIVIFEPSKFKELGITYLQSDTRMNHFNSSNVEYINKNIKKALKTFIK